MKIIMHIGTHKTGSTYLQDLLKANKEKLRNSSFLFPVTADNRSGHHELAFSLQKRDIENSVKILEYYKSQLNDHEALVISSEEFEFIQHVDDIEEVFDIVFGVRKYSIELIVYLRRQDDYLESEYNQHVKMYDVRYSGDIYQFYMYHDFNKRFNYYNLLSKFNKLLGVKAIHAFSYDIVKQQNSLLKEFLSVLNVDVNLDLSMNSVDSNISLSNYAICELSLYNEKYDLDKAQHIALLSSLKEKYSNLKSEKTKLLPVSYRKKLVSKYRHQNFLVEKYFMVEGQSLNDLDFKELKVVTRLDTPIKNNSKEYAYNERDTQN